MMRDRDIEKFFDLLERRMDRMQSPMVGDLADEFVGYRKEIVDGDMTEYINRGSGWHELGEGEDDDDVHVGVTAGSDEPTVYTVDLSEKISEDREPDSIEYNNGIVEISFGESDEDEE